MSRKTFTRFSWKSRLLTAEEEVSLGRRTRDGLAAIERVPIGPPTKEDAAERGVDLALIADRLVAREVMARCNLPLVRRIAAGYATRTQCDSDDAFGAGQLGLLRAIDHYDPERGFRFATYAWYLIFQSMQRHYQMQKQYLSLDCKADGTEGAVATVTITAKEVSTRHEEIAVSMSTFAELLATLPPRDARVMSLRFGLGGNDPMTLESIGAVIKVSKERVRQIQVRVINTLRRQFLAKPEYQESA